MDPDRELVRGLVRREMGALREAYERHGARVQRLCQRLLGCPLDAEDATHEVFLKLFERAGTFDGRARFSTWLYRLTVNHCLHRLERARLRAADALPEGDASPSDPGDSPLEELTRSEVRASLERLLLRLAPEQRAVLVLRELEGQSYAEIAATLAIPLGTVMSRLSRSREALTRLASRSRDPLRSLPRSVPQTP